MQLYPYQQATIDALLSPPAGISRSLVVIATGGGKTIVFASLLDRLLQSGERALILAHREELLTQAREKIAKVAPSLHVEIEQAEKRASTKITGWSAMLRQIDRSVVVASVQTLRGERLAKWPRDTFRLIVIDEAHHSTASSYQDILKHFGCFDEENPTRLVGVTATPGRTDKVGLGAVYQEIAAEYGIRELIRMGYLASVRALNVTSQVSLDGIKTVKGDFQQSELERRIDVSARNELIVSAYEEHALGLQTIVFAAGVSHAHHIAELFRARGHAAAPIWGDMEKDDRRKTLDAYSRGDIPILTNYGVLTEGFDAPETRCIILARPTKSSLVITQCIGRGTRLAPGKESCLVLDVRDCTAGKNLVSAATLAGLPPTFDPKGKNVMELGDEYDELDSRLKPAAIDADKLSQFVKQVKEGMSVAEIDLFGAIRVDPVIRERSSLAWLPSGEESWEIRTHLHRYGIHADTLGRYLFTRDGRTLAVETNADTIFRFADAWLGMQHQDEMHYLDLSFRWRKKPATEAQIKALTKRLNVKELPPNLTAGDASLLLNSLQKS